jgi:calcineurin-like phosphoesterase family protein
MFDFFTADWHLFHGNIIDYCSRPFTSLKQMHGFMIAAHNAIVGPEDHVWILGDVTLKGPENCGQVRKEVNKFNGIKHLVLGNHDDWRARTYLQAGFTTVHSAMWFPHEGRTFYMMHDPAEYNVIQNDPNAMLLCGHIHNLFDNLLPDKRIINVGVDAWKMKPVSIEQIMEVIANAEGN